MHEIIVGFRKVKQAVKNLNVSVVILTTELSSLKAQEKGEKLSKARTALCNGAWRAMSHSSSHLYQEKG